MMIDGHCGCLPVWLTRLQARCDPATLAWGVRPGQAGVSAAVARRFDADVLQIEMQYVKGSLPIVDDAGQ
jgi:hypothetical protein